MTNEVWCSYPKVWAIGHTNIRTIFSEPVIVEEKVDGSQFSFGMFDGALRMRSRGKDQTHDTDQLFKEAAQTCARLFQENRLVEGWMYSGEYLKNPKHNTLEYSRVPDNHIVLFDVRRGIEDYCSYDDKVVEATRLGLEVVPKLFEGKIDSVEQIQELLETESFLGGPKIEGIVVKSYVQFTRDGKAMMGKYVSENFKEKHSKEWKKSNPTNKDIIGLISESLRTEARWRKAMERLRDAGMLKGEPKDIGPLIEEIKRDVQEEEREYICDRLFAYAWKHIGREITYGVPEWYKKLLMETSFEL